MNKSNKGNPNIDLNKLHLLQNICSSFRQLAIEKSLFSCLMSINDI